MGSMCLPRHPKRRGDTGSTALEYALVVPVLLLVMFGIIQYGMYFWSASTAAASAREAAREMAVGTDWDCTRTAALEKAGQASFGGTPTAQLGYLNAANTAKVGDRLRVTVTVHSFNLELLPLPGDGTVTQSAESRVSNLPPTPVACA